MRQLVRTVLFAALLALALCAAGTLLVVRIEPGQAGVRQNNWSGEIEPRDYGAGLHLAVRGVHAWHAIDARSRVLRFGEHPAEGDRPPLEIRTREKNNARVELAVIWRVRPGQAHELVKSGLERVSEQRLAASVEDALRAKLAELGSQDWFGAEARAAAAAQLLPGLNEQCAGYHVEVEALFLRGATFASEYEKKLQEQQVDVQRDLLADAVLDLERAKSERERVGVETEAMVKEKRARWEHEKAGLVAQAELGVLAVRDRAARYEAEVRLAADRAHAEALAASERELAEASALRARLRLEALDSPGGAIRVATEAARNLKLESAALDSSDPRVPSLFDLDQLTKLLIGGGS